MASQGDWLGSSLWICLVRMKCIGGVNLDSGVCHEKVNEVMDGKDTRPFQNPRKLFMRSDHSFHYSCKQVMNICILHIYNIDK